MPPAAFVQLVIDLLTAVGHGGPLQDAGLVVGGEATKGSMA
jgi:hypothetical protein